MIKLRLLINGEEVTSDITNKKEIERTKKEILTSLNELGKEWGADIENDSISIEFDFGNGYYCKQWKASSEEIRKSV